MKNSKNNQNAHSQDVPKIHHEPYRVASRMEGVVKNRGIKTVKKPNKN